MPKGFGEGSKTTQFKPLSEPIEKRFHDSYIPEPNSGCWLWIANCDNKGYGRIREDGKFVLAHRVSWRLHYGRRTRKFVLHHCDIPCCVNPDHLYVGTQKDNMRDRSIRNRMAYQLGESGPRAILTEAQVIAIRADTRSQSAIGRAYGVTQGCVHNIKARKSWKHI